MKSRTAIEREANEIDRQLFNLASRVERLREEHRNRPASLWYLLMALKHARRYARELMHPEDVKATQ